MKSPLKLALLVSAAALAAPTASAQVGPVAELIYAAVHSGFDSGGVIPGGGGSNASFFTVLSVTNTCTQPVTPNSLGGSTNVQFNYVNTVANPADSQLPLDCYVVDRVEHLTPGDTLSVLTNCHNAATARGWALVQAQDPTKFKTAWDFPFLIGHSLVVNSQGGTYAINAIPANSVSSRQYMEFLAVAGSSLTIGHFQDPTGNSFFVPATVQLAFDIFNDNEFQLSSTKVFKCWFDEPLSNVSPVFREEFLRNNTPHDPQELDIDCDGVGDFETGWAIITAILANTETGVTYDPPIFGAVTSGPAANIDGARHLWPASSADDGGVGTL